MSQASVDLHDFLKSKVDGCIFHDSDKSAFCTECEPYYLLLKMLDGLREKRKAGWVGFRNVLYGWCVPLNQINEFFDELLGKEKEDG